MRLLPLSVLTLSLFGITAHAAAELTLEQCLTLKALNEARYESEMIGPDSVAAEAFALVRSFHEEQEQTVGRLHDLVAAKKGRILEFLKKRTNPIPGNSLGDQEVSMLERSLQGALGPEITRLRAIGHFLPQHIATGGRADLHRVQPFVEVSDKEVTYGVCIVHQAETGYSNQTRYYGCIKDRYRLVTYGKGPELEFTRFPADDGGQYAQFQFHGEPQKNLWTDFDRETWVTKQIGFVCEARIRKAYPLAQETADRIAEKARQELEFVRESAGNQK